MSQPAVKRQRNTEMLRAPSVRDVGMSMLLLLAGRASVLGLFPFGVAFFASCFDKSIAYLGITVLSIALMTSASRSEEHTSNSSHRSQSRMPSSA